MIGQIPPKDKTDDRPLSVQIADAVAALEECQRDYEEARKVARSASGSETSARNRLNNAQKAVDELVTRMRQESPRDTDWWNSRNSRQGRAEG